MKAIKRIANILATHFHGQWYLEFQEKTNFSNIYFFTDGNRKMVVKTVVSDSFVDLDESKKMVIADQMNRNIGRFRELLASFQVPLSKEFMALVSQDTLEPIHIASYEGPDCLKLIQADPSKQNVKRLLRGILTSVVGVLHQPTPLKVGTDLQLANFTLNGRLRYVDIFPPLIWDEANKYYIVHEPQPSDPEEVEQHVFRKFTMEGTLRRLRFFVLSLSKEYEPILMQEIKNVLSSDAWNKFDNYLNHLPDVQFREIKPNSKSILIKTFDSLEGNDYDSMRDLALRIIPDGVERATEIYRVFRMARYPGHNDSRDSQNPKEEVKEFLLKYLN